MDGDHFWYGAKMLVWTEIVISVDVPLVCSWTVWLTAAEGSWLDCLSNSAVILKFPVKSFRTLHRPRTQSKQFMLALKKKKKSRQPHLSPGLCRHWCYVLRRTWLWSSGSGWSWEGYSDSHWLSSCLSRGDFLSWETRLTQASHMCVSESMVLQILKTSSKLNLKRIL